MVKMADLRDVIVPNSRLLLNTHKCIKGLCFIKLNRCKGQKLSISLKVICNNVIHYLCYTSNTIVIIIITPPPFYILDTQLRHESHCSGVLVSICRKSVRMCVYQAPSNVGENVVLFVDLGTSWQPPCGQAIRIPSKAPAEMRQFTIEK